MRSFLLLGLFSILSLCAASCEAQVWTPSEDQDYHEAIVEVIAGPYMGSGTVVKFIKFSDDNPEYYWALILTASHVVPDSSQEIHIKFNSGILTTGGKVVKKCSFGYDGFNDLCVIKALVHKSVKPMEIYDGAEIEPNEEVELAGFGHKDGFRHWVAPYGGDIHTPEDVENSKAPGHVIFSWGIQGDSGGPVIYKGKVIGVICYGNGLRKHEDTHRLEVGPVCSSNALRVKKYIENFS